MSPLATLFGAVVALYLIECVLVAPEGALVLVEGRRGRWRLARHGFALGALHKRVTLLPPAAPQRSILVLPEWTVSLGLAGFAYRDPHDGAASARYEELTQVATDGGVVRWRGGAAPVSSASRAHWLERTLSALRDTPERSRSRAIDKALDELTSAERVRSRVDTLRNAVRLPRLFGLVLFAHLFVVWPVGVRWLGIGLTWPVILVELLVLQTLICHSYVRARRGLRREQLDASGASVLTLALSPPAAARCAGALGRDLLGDAHPLAVVLQLCREEDARAVATSALREARHHLMERDGEASEPNRVEAWFAHRWRQSLEALLERTVGLSSIPSAPHREGDSASYCPRCWTQYATSEGRCADCRGLPLLGFAHPA